MRPSGLIAPFANPGSLGPRTVLIFRKVVAFHVVMAPLVAATSRLSAVAVAATIPVSCMGRTVGRPPRAIDQRWTYAAPELPSGFTADHNRYRKRPSGDVKAGSM